MISSKFLYVVGSPSPEKAMSLRRRRWGGTSRNFGRVVDRAGGDQFERRAQLVDEGVGFDEAGFALAAAVDLAVDAVEVADLVGVEIHADRDAAGPPAEHRVDEPVVLEEPGVIGVELVGGHGGEAGVRGQGSEVGKSALIHDTRPGIAGSRLA